MYGMLNNGIEKQGAATRTYDKYGKRMWTATPVKDTSTKHKVLVSGKSEVGNAVPSSTKQTTADKGGL